MCRNDPRRRHAPVRPAQSVVGIDLEEVAMMESFVIWSYGYEWYPVAVHEVGLPSTFYWDCAAVAAWDLLTQRRHQHVAVTRCGMTFGGVPFCDAIREWTLADVVMVEAIENLIAVYNRIDDAEEMEVHDAAE